MILLHQIGNRVNPNFNTLEEILASEGPLSFDGIYESVYKNYKELKGKDITFFYAGKYLGKDNSFDRRQPFSNFCTLEQIYEMADFLNAKVGYHSWSHVDCRKLTTEELRAELRPLPPFKGLRPITTTFAWPYGDYDYKAIEIAKELGYTEAWSVIQGDDANPFAKKRKFLNW